jgi:hypothetical protein
MGRQKLEVVQGALTCIWTPSTNNVPEISVAPPSTSRSVAVPGWSTTVDVTFRGGTVLEDSECSRLDAAGASADVQQSIRQLVRLLLP